MYVQILHPNKREVKKKMNKLKTFRQMYKISQIDLAEVLNTTQQQVHLYESGKRQLREEQIRTICTEYGCSADFLLGLKDSDK